MAEQRRAMTWDQFKILFFDCYFPRSLKEYMYRDFLNLRQEENKSIVEYERIVPVPIETYVQCVDIKKTRESEARDFREKESPDRGATSNMVVRVAIRIWERVSGMVKRVIISEIVLLEHQGNLAHEMEFILDFRFLFNAT
ncbi:hypothetical protein RJ639_038384 [Escallonia herrerae]|uniref:Retrotransposon gag domain-containing protein n=1 Tax=Escallonia herrerae TaxID=1293975 RepID=A0AA88WLS2_9ASTE|nr:hypothetical protein RJ639_038384 [Escallonia herrerae]